MSQLSERRDEVTTDRTVVVVAGQTPAAVVGALPQAGYDAEALDGGPQAWSRVGLPLVPDDGTRSGVA